MDEIEALRRIVASACTIKGRAALSHLPSHRIWVNRLHDAMSEGLSELRTLTKGVLGVLQDTSRGSPAAQTGHLNLFCSGLPRLAEHELLVLEKLLSDVELTSACRRGQGNPEKTFRDFNRLVSSVRQFVDTSVQTSFQLAVLDARELNFHVLNSLASFVELATDSLQDPIMNQELLELLDEFRKLSWSDRKNNAFCGTKFERFGQKVDLIAKRVIWRFHSRAAESTKALFRFSSEFTHAGHISTLITSSNSEGIYLGTEEDCFFPSTENFVELQYVLLKRCVVILGDFFISALGLAVTELLAGVDAGA